jgi:hypothetical protein
METDKWGIPTDKEVDAVLREVSSDSEFLIGKYTITSPDACYLILQQTLDLKSSSVEKFGIITLTSKSKIAGIHIARMRPCATVLEL